MAWEVMANAVAHWRLNESSGTSAADDTGNGHTGTYAGSPTLAQAGGLLGAANDNAVTFGSGQYMSVAPDAALELTSEFTIGAWVKWAATPGTEAMIFCSGWDGAGPILFSLGFNFAGESGLTFGFYDGSNWHVTPGVPAPSNGDWHHIVGAWDGTELNLYVDGAVSSFDTPGVSATTETSSCYVNVNWHIDNASTTRYGAFTVDEVFVCSVGHSAADITANYNANVAGFGASFNRPITEPVPTSAVFNRPFDVNISAAFNRPLSVYTGAGFNRPIDAQLGGAFNRPITEALAVSLDFSRTWTEGGQVPVAAGFNRPIDIHISSDFSRPIHPAYDTPVSGSFNRPVTELSTVPASASFNRRWNELLPAYTSNPAPSAPYVGAPQGPFVEI